MSPRALAEVLREMADIRVALGDIRPGCARRPHEFPEAILALQERQRAVELRIRNELAGRFPNCAKTSEAATGRYK